MVELKEAVSKITKGQALRKRVLVLLLVLLFYASIFAILSYWTLEVRSEVSPLIMPVVFEFNAPFNSPTGLAFDGESIWISSVSSSIIHALDPRTGRIVRNLTTPVSVPFGLAWDGTCLWVDDYSTLMIFRINTTTGSVVSSIKAPGETPSGLTWDGNYLWVSDFSTEKIYRVNTTSGSVLQAFYAPPPASKPSGLAWDGTSLWVADVNTNFVLKLNTSKGEVVSYYYSSGYFPGGLAWDGKHLWLSDYSNDKVYQTLPGERQVKITRLTVPSWIWPTMLMSILPVLLSIFAALNSDNATGSRKPDSEGSSRHPWSRWAILIGTVLAVLGSIYASYELFRIIYSVAIQGRLVLPGDSPMWLYRAEMLLCIYTIAFWICFALARVRKSFGR